MKSNVFLGWWQVAVCVLILCVSVGTIVLAFSLVAMPLGKAFATSRTELMFAITVEVLVSSILAPLLGPALDRYSIRNLMLAGATSLTLAFLALSFTTTMRQVLVIYGLFMAPATVLLGPMAVSALLSRWFIKRRGFAIGIATAGISLGGFIFPPVIQALIDTLEWRWAFRCVSLIIAFSTLPAIVLLVVNNPSDRKLHPDNESHTANVSGQERGEQFGSTGAVLKDISFWMIAAATGVMFCGLRGLLANLAPLAMDIGIRPERAALLISLVSVGAFTGKMLFVVLGDRVDSRLILVGALVVFALGNFCFWYAAGYPILVVGAIVAGLPLGGVVPLQGFLVACAFGTQNVGRVMGLMTLAILPFQLLVPVYFGWTFDRTGNYDEALLGLMGLAIAAIAAPPLLRTYPRGRPAESETA